MALRHMVTEGVSVHFVILLVDRGWSTEAGEHAARCIGVYRRAVAPGGRLAGRLVDKRKFIMLLLLALAGSVAFMGYTAEPYCLPPA